MTCTILDGTRHNMLYHQQAVMQRHISYAPTCYRLSKKVDLGISSLLHLFEPLGLRIRSANSGLKQLADASVGPNT